VFIATRAGFGLALRSTRPTLAVKLPLKVVVRDHRGAVLLSVLLTSLLSASIIVVQ
jgi:hypothetical protein